MSHNQQTYKCQEQNPQEYREKEMIWNQNYNLT